MQTKAIKTVDLEGPALDWAVAKATGRLGGVKIINGSPPLILLDGNNWSPSTDGRQGMVLIETFSIMIDKNFEDFSTTEEPWFATTDYFWATGATVLTALCRAIVKRKLGETVEVPAVLITNKREC